MIDNYTDSKLHFENTIATQPHFKCHNYTALHETATHVCLSSLLLLNWGQLTCIAPVGIRIFRDFFYKHKVEELGLV